MTETAQAARIRISDSDLEVFPLNLGGNVFGWTADAEASAAVLDGYVAAGGNFVDTADAYSAWAPGHTGGESEQVIGDWMRARGNRDEIVVATKVSRHPEFRRLAAENVRAAADASLQRLGLRERAEREGLAVFPYFCLAKGFLAGKYRDGADAPGPSSPRAAAASTYLDDRGRSVLGVLDRIAAAHDVPVASVALAWLRVQPTVVAPIASARDTDQLPALVASATLELGDDELSELSAAAAETGAEA